MLCYCPQHLSSTRSQQPGESFCCSLALLLPQCISTLLCVSSYSFWSTRSRAPTVCLCIGLLCENNLVSHILLLGLTCHCNVHDGSADSCAQGTNQCSVGAYACVIEAIQAGSVIRQRCSTVDLDQYICDPQRFDPKLSNEGLACCITDNCNTEEFLRMFLPTAPPPVPTDPGSSGDDDPELPTNTSSSISQPPTSTPVAPLFTTLPSSTTVQLTVPTTPSASPVYSPSATTTSTGTCCVCVYGSDTALRTTVQ